MKRKPSEWEKIIANEISDKGLISKIYKHLIQFNARKTNNLIKKWEKDLNRHFFKEATNTWCLKNTWKDAQHHSLLQKCKSKLQCDTNSHQSEWPSSKKATSNKCWRGCGEKGTFLHCWWECKLIHPLWKMVWRFLKN